MSRHIIQAADGSRHIIEIADAPTAAPAPAAAPSPPSEINLVGEDDQVNLGKSTNPAIEAYRLESKRGTGAPSGLEEFAGGLKHSWDKSSVGLKGLAREDTPEDKELVQQGREFVKGTGPLSSVGEFVGDVVTGIGPVKKGAAVLKAVSAPVLSKFPRLAAALADVGANAGWSAATAPEDRGLYALAGAGGALAGRALGHAATGGSPLGVTAGPQSRWLASQGVVPSLGQSMAEKGGMLPKAINWLEQKAMQTDVPILGKSIKVARQRARSQAEAQGINPNLTGILDDTTLPGWGVKAIKRIMPRGAWGGTVGGAILASNPTLIGKTVAAALMAKGYSTELVQKWMSGQLKGAQASQMAKIAEEVIQQSGREMGEAVGGPVEE